MGEVWEDLGSDLKFLGSFQDQATGIAEARREATLCAPSTVIVLAPDGARHQVIEVEGN